MRALVTPAAAGAFWFLSAIWIASSVKADPICLSLHSGNETTLVPATPGSDLRLSFLHSIYGSSVEERFYVTADGFQTAGLRYAEIRAAEYYGHEFATFENGWWVVDERGRNLATLALQVSNESSIRITLSDRSLVLQKSAALGTHVRLSVVPCPRENSGP